MDRLLADEQHGVRWARHWLDVLRYADLDGLDGSVMPAANGIYLWRDWVIQALNHDMPYDQFVRAQILGNRYRAGDRRPTTSATGRASEGSVEDTFALGFLARAAVTRDDKDHDISFAAVETISTAFMGMTVGCAKCHDHKFDPITQKDFYAMKALFDPLVLKNVMLATPAEIFANGQKLDEYKKKNAPIQRRDRSAGRSLQDQAVRRARGAAHARRAGRSSASRRSSARPPNRRSPTTIIPVLRVDPSKIKADHAEGGGREIRRAAETAGGAGHASRRCPLIGRWKKIRRC